MNPKFILKSLLLTSILVGVAILSGARCVSHAAETERIRARTAEVETENGYYYTVQKGDTLWDLSRRFSTTPWVWPELWEDNSQTVSNPHLIYPGQKIRLTRIAESRRAGAADRGAAEAPVAGIHYYFSPIDQYGFIRKVPVAPEGIILKPQESGRQMISEGDVIYIRPEGNSALSRGARLTIYRTLTPLVDQKTKELIGTQHLLCGVLEIVQREPQYAVARVLDSYRPIQIGDLLMPYQRRSPRIEIKDSQPGIDGKLIISEERLNVFAESHVAFINQGRRQGIQPGQIYNIYRSDEHNFGNASSPKTVSIPLDYGELLVLHTEDDTSTVLITDSKKESQEGTRIRTPLAMR